MSKVRNMPFGISLFLVFLIFIEIYYFFYDFLTEGLFAHYGYVLADLSSIPYLLVLLFLYILVGFALFTITYGFILRRHWARKFAIIYVLWAALWPLWGLLVGNNVWLHFIFLIVYILTIYYLMTSYVIKYFVDVFTYGEYTLYTREVELNSGRIVTIYFFSKHVPKSGTPSPMPEGYEVGINERSNLPYLQKIGKPKPYKYGDYTLYKRNVKLNGGKTITIYFFSRKKPKSGTPTPMPEGYKVGINKRSNMPYLKKETSKKTVVVEENKANKANEEAKRKSSNVIYVVSKPQPGQVRGDWAVRGHGKIYSHHRKKETAINQARKIARKRNATVMVQNIDGTFSEGFKPKTK